MAGQIRDQKYRSPAKPIAQRAANELKYATRSAPDHQHRTERKPRTGELQREPRKRHQIELVAEKRNALADKKKPEVTGPKRPPEWESAQAFSEWSLQASSRDGSEGLSEYLSFQFATRSAMESGNARLT